MKPVYVSKYEATMHMKRHIRVTQETEPSYSTRRWREPEASHKFPKQTGQQEQIDKKVKEENLLLSRKMYEVATEDRVNRTSEYAPGWRTGVCGTVIDCYPTAKKQVLNYKKFREDNRERDELRRQKLLNQENVALYRYLQNSRTSYSQKEQAKFYSKNRVLYNMYANRPHTALHLGIYDKANKELSRERSKRPDSIATGVDSSGVFSSQQNKVSRSSLLVDGNNGDVVANRRLLQLNGDHHATGETRPTTANNNSNTSNTSKHHINKLRRKLDEIQSVADFINLQIDNTLEFPLSDSAPIKPKDWNPATNDNLRNSEGNANIVKYKLKPAYVEKRTIQTGYLRDVEKISDLLPRPTPSYEADGNDDNNDDNYEDKSSVLLAAIGEKQAKVNSTSRNTQRPHSASAPQLLHNNPPLSQLHSSQQHTSLSPFAASAASVDVDEGSPMFNLYEKKRTSSPVLPVKQRPQSSVAKSQPKTLHQKPPHKSVNMMQHKLSSSSDCSFRPQTAPTNRQSNRRPQPADLTVCDSIGNGNAAISFIDSATGGGGIVDGESSGRIIEYVSDPLDYITLPVPRRKVVTSSTYHDHHIHDQQRHSTSTNNVVYSSSDYAYQTHPAAQGIAINNNYIEPSADSSHREVYEHNNSNSNGHNSANNHNRQIKNGTNCSPQSAGSPPRQRPDDRASTIKRRNHSSPPRVLSAAFESASIVLLQQDQPQQQQQQQEQQQQYNLTSPPPSQQTQSQLQSQTQSQTGTPPSLRKFVSFDDRVNSKEIDYHRAWLKGEGESM